MLSGTTVLIVEDEYIIALEVQRILEAAGATAVIAATGIDDTIPPAGRPFDLAIVAVPPHSPETITLCAALYDRGTAVVALTSGQIAQDTPAADEVRQFVVVPKPFPDHDLLAAAAAALAARRTTEGSVS